MNSGVDKDWKNNLGFTINYDSGQSTDEDIDLKDVVMRHPRQSSRYLLAENGDGSEADLLGTTPPRARIRDKEKRRNIFDAGMNMQRSPAEGKSPTDLPTPPERFKKRISLKVIRNKERDWKDGQRESRADSLPSPSPQAAVPTLVESCSRFMSLTSRLKCKEECEEIQERQADEELPLSRVNFHSTFSMLINMGNMDKGCRRTISREEQVWQNELKDLIWLELKAKLAGRSLAAQDEELCRRRSLVPALIQRIQEYRFENPSPCGYRPRRLSTIDAAVEDSEQTPVADEEQSNIPDPDSEETCICVAIDCDACTSAVGAAMRQLLALLDAVDAAVALYPSSSAAAEDYPALFSPEVTNRLKAMCLWYNTALHMRLKVMSVRRMLRTVRDKARLPSSSSESRKSSVTQRPCQVRFNISTSASDSNNSDASGNSVNRYEKPLDGGKERDKLQEHSQEEANGEVQRNGDRSKDVIDCSFVKSDTDRTPEVTVSETYSTTDTSSSNESGYTSEHEDAADVFELGALRDVARLRLMGRTEVSAYRDYHYEMLKTQGVRRCMTFMNKMSNKLLNKVYRTLQDPRDPEDLSDTEDTKDTEHKTDSTNYVNNTYEFRRYGCWSEESLAMNLPSYRNHFLLLTSISMEAVHDYLTMRLEGRPDHPSCLTIKQLIHELKEGLDIAAETRASFARNVLAALRRACVAGDARDELKHVLHKFDATVETVLQQYLSYLRTISETEPLSRARLSAEWSFTARLATRAPPVAALAPPAFADMACNQLKQILNRFEEKFQKVMKMEESDHSEVDERYVVYAVCREAQCIYSSEREAALQAAQWARALAVRLAHTHREHSDRIFECLMAIRDCLVRQTHHILEKSEPLAMETPKELRDSLGARVRELLLQVYKLGFQLHVELHRFAAAPPRPRLPRRPASLQPPARASPRPARRPGTMLLSDTMHKELYRFVNETPQSKSSSRGPVDSPRRMKLLRSESIGEEVEPSAMEDSAFGSPADIESLLSGRSPPRSPVPTRPAPPPPRPECGRVARAVIEFAKCWMKFVIERCDRGRGLRPRWASQGLEFLMLACDPCNTKHLSEEEFEALKHLMDGCISHVVGSRGDISPAPPRQRHRVHSPLPPCPAASPAVGTDAPLELHLVEDNVHKRIFESVQLIDEARDEKLRNAKSVGRVLESTVKSYEPKLRQLTFKWQRGLKIGAGTFGKVYTVVNTETGQVLAMKELSVVAGDRRALQRAANELSVLEGVRHAHLVRYYGCELHREEMLIFMELCVEGSLEALVATSGALAEQTTRRYTKQLVSAVTELHSRAIVHRDIKSGNIFLTSEGDLKLGDFGCAVKIRANTTAPGELQGFVGTQAYMAPEVFMKSSGHGRSADVWSLGCVVTEMASGKRPFSEYDSNYQIMFVVGMGRRPHVPESLSEEGRQFCLSCLTHDPDERPRAEELGLYHFLMVKSDDDCGADRRN